MSRRHGRAVIPFGKYKGVRIRLIPDGYLSWLTTTPMMRAPEWRWLWESVAAELRWRGFNLTGVFAEQPVSTVPTILTYKRKIREDLPI